MDTIKDLWASLVASITERSTNPLTGAFAVSWAAWNYKFFVLLFSDLSPAKTFAGIQELYADPLDRLLSGFAFPFVTALLYVFVYPYLTGWLVPWYRQRQVLLANSLKKIEGKRVRTVEEVTRIVREYEQKINAADADQKAARAEAGALRNALDAAELELKNLRMTSSELSEANRQMVHDRINDRNIQDNSVRKSADDFIEAFSLRTNMASSDLLQVIGPLSRAELKILFYLGDSGERRATPIETGNFMQMNASDVMPLLHRLAERDLIILRNDSASIAYKGRSVLERMREVVNIAA